MYQNIDPKIKNVTIFYSINARIERFTNMFNIMRVVAIITIILIKYTNRFMNF